MHSYKRCMTIRDARLREIHAYDMAVDRMHVVPCEMHAHEVALVRDTPMRWPMGDARL